MKHIEAHFLAPKSASDSLRVLRGSLRILFPAIHMPARIYPLPFAQNKDLSDAAGLGDMLAASLQLVRVVRVDNGGGAIDLDFGFRKLEFDQLAATLRKLRRTVKNCLAV